MKTNNKLEVVFDLDDGKRLLVNVAPLKLLFEQQSRDNISDLVRELQQAKDVMVQSMSPGNVASHLRELQDAHASMTTLIHVFEQLNYQVL